jgi:hypothetical protein
MLRRWILKMAAGSAAVGILSVALHARKVEAKASYESPYTLAQTYNASLRLVRVDLGLAVTEKDPTVAYVLFDYKSTESGARVVPGSIQMLDTGRAVKVVVQLGQMPRYHEQVVVDALAKKLRDEYGDPTPRTRPPEADAGPDTNSPSGE